jgi:ribonucleotide monophosphatase NagD (HAD superfamily)
MEHTFAASKVGTEKILVRTGAGEEALGKYRYKWSNVEPDYIADHFLDAVKWILRDKK